MRIVHLLIKTLLIACAAIAIFFYIIINHSTTQLTMTCHGEWQDGQSETVYAVLEEYRPWIFWGDSDGNFRIEAKNQSIVRYVSKVSSVGKAPLTNYFLWERSGEMIGGYRGGPNELTFAFIKGWVFVGQCTEGI